MAFSVDTHVLLFYGTFFLLLCSVLHKVEQTLHPVSENRLWIWRLQNISYYAISKLKSSLDKMW